MTNKPRRRLSERSGFSLTEILLVLMLIGIGLSLAAPSFGGMLRSHRADSVSALLANDLTLARMTAVRTGRPVSLVVSSATRYRVEVQSDPVRLVKEVRLATEHPGFTIAADPSTVTFSSRGMVASAASATITITGGPATKVVTVSPVGRVYRGN